MSDGKTRGTPRESLKDCPSVPVESFVRTVFVESRVLQYWVFGEGRRGKRLGVRVGTIPQRKRGVHQEYVTEVLP